jgi:hypothetical protein
LSGLPGLGPKLARLQLKLAQHPPLRHPARPEPLHQAAGLARHPELALFLPLL